jgi:hypothetical protein
MARRKTKKTTKYLSKKKQLQQQTLLVPKAFSRRKVYLFMAVCAAVFTFSVVAASRSIQATANTVPDSFKSLPQWRLEKVVTEMTEGYPIAKMLPYIFEQDQLTTAYLVSIAKKESNWGKKSPKKDGQDCYNYWGYKGEGSRGIAAGHGCFGSPEEAVETVAKRIDILTQDYELESPGQMVVWKCGYSCDGHSDASVKKWISDVAYYTEEIQEAKN